MKIWETLSCSLKSEIDCVTNLLSHISICYFEFPYPAEVEKLSRMFFLTILLSSDMLFYPYCTGAGRQQVIFDDPVDFHRIIYPSMAVRSGTYSPYVLMFYNSDWWESISFVYWGSFCIETLFPIPNSDYWEQFMLLQLVLIMLGHILFWLILLIWTKYVGTLVGTDSFWFIQSSIKSSRSFGELQSTVDLRHRVVAMMHQLSECAKENRSRRKTIAGRALCSQPVARSLSTRATPKWVSERLERPREIARQGGLNSRWRSAVFAMLSWKRGLITVWALRLVIGKNRPLVQNIPLAFKFFSSNMHRAVPNSVLCSYPPMRPFFLDIILFYY